MEFGVKKRGQVTVFIILAIVVVAAIVVAFFMFGGVDILRGGVTNPTKYIQNCAEENAKNVLENIEEHGGVYYSENNKINFLEFGGLDIAKLCYTEKKRTNCENKHPMFNEEIELKIRDYVRPRLDKCFADLKNLYSSEDFTEGQLNFSVKIEQERVVLIIRKPINIFSDGGSVSVNSFDTSLSSNLYSFLEVTNSILNQELSCDCANSNCNADLGKMNLWYPGYSTSRFLTENSDKIYTIEDSNQNKFMFAIRNCAGVEL